MADVFCLGVSFWCGLLFDGGVGWVRVGLVLGCWGDLLSIVWQVLYGDPKCGRY